MRALGQNPTESEVKKLVNEHRADDRVTFEVFLPMLQVILKSGMQLSMTQARLYVEEVKADITLGPHHLRLFYSALGF